MPSHRQHDLADHARAGRGSYQASIGSGPHWLMVSDLEDALRPHGVELDGDELRQAIAIAQERCELKTEAEPNKRRRHETQDCSRAA